MECTWFSFAKTVKYGKMKIVVSMPTGQTDGQTDRRTPDRYIMLSSRRGQRNDGTSIYRKLSVNSRDCYCKFICCNENVFT